MNFDPSNIPRLPILIPSNLQTPDELIAWLDEQPVSERGRIAMSSEMMEAMVRVAGLETMRKMNSTDE